MSETNIAVLRKAREHVSVFGGSPIMALAATADTTELQVRLIGQVEKTLGVGSLVDWYWGPDDMAPSNPLRSQAEVLAAFDATIARLEGANG